MGPIVALAIQELPSLVAAFKTLFHKTHPDEPQPTDAEVLAAFDQAYRSSVAKDEAWLAAHPEP